MKTSEPPIKDYGLADHVIYGLYDGEELVKVGLTKNYPGRPKQQLKGYHCDSFKIIESLPGTLREDARHREAHWQHEFDCPDDPGKRRRRKKDKEIPIITAETTDRDLLEENKRLRQANILLKRRIDDLIMELHDLRSRM